MTAEDPFESTRMTLGEHLDELRSRLFKGVLAVVVAFALCWSFYERVKDVVLGPFDQARVMINAKWTEDANAKLAAHPELSRDEYFEKIGGEDRLRNRVRPPQVLSAGEGFLFALKTCLYFALFLGGPVLLWQLWQFIAAGLHRHERRAALRYFPYSVLLFVSGVVFGYFMLVPYAMFFLGTAFPPDEVQPSYTLSTYLKFISSLSLALGAVFQLPLLMVFFARLGLVDPRTYSRYRGHFVLGAFVVAAVLTPPDPITQFMMAVPMVLLYELGLWCARIFARPRAAADVTDVAKGASA